jgi:signal transduction histidine kinase
METIETPTEAEWVNVLQQLHDFLQHSEDSGSFLRRIDQMYNAASVTLEQFVSSALGSLRRFSNATEAHFYVDSGDDLLLFHTTRSQGATESLEASLLSSMLPFSYKELQVVGRSRFGDAEQIFPDSKSLLLIPVWLSESQRFGVVILEGRPPENATPFRDKAVQSFIQTIVGQLAFGIRFRMNEHRSEWLRELYASFFDLGLEPSACFNRLAKGIPGFLPTFGPFRMEREPEVQVLIYREAGHYLIVVGTTGRETGAKVKIEDSTMGLLFEDPYPAYVLGDPRTDPLLKKRYKAYLGKETGKEIRTELAVPVKTPDGARIAVVNLESESRNAFTKVHVDAVVDLCDILVPIITGLYESIIEMERRQEVVLGAQRSYWNTVGAILRHNTRSPLLSIRLSVDNVKGALRPDQAEEIGRILAPIYDSVTTVTQQIEEFSGELYNLTVYGKYSIRSLISKTIKRFQQSLAKGQQVVRIDFPESEDFEVYCSPALEMHLYNIIDNSIHWVQERVKMEAGYQGRISVIVRPGPLPAEDQEIELNRTCEVIVEDNGVGCSKELLDKLFYQPVKSRRTGEEGMGHALYAAGNYIAAISGSVSAESKGGEWFRVTINLPIFNPRVHQIRTGG